MTDQVTDPDSLLKHGDYHVCAERLNRALRGMEQKHTTSMSVYIAYWECRNALRALAMERFRDVFESHKVEGVDTGFVEDGLASIRKDETSDMLVLIDSSKDPYLYVGRRVKVVPGHKDDIVDGFEGLCTGVLDGVLDVRDEHDNLFCVEVWQVCLA